MVKLTPSPNTLVTGNPLVGPSQRGPSTSAAPGAVDLGCCLHADEVTAFLRLPLFLCPFVPVEIHLYRTA